MRLKLSANAQIGCALLLSVVTAIAFRQLPIKSNLFWEICKIGGILFMNALQMLIVPLVVTATIRGILATEREKLGRMGWTVLLYSLVTAGAAIFIGITITYLIKPGIVAPDVAEKLLSSIVSDSGMLNKPNGLLASDILESILPPNIVAATTNNRALVGLILFSFLFGLASQKLPEKLKRLHQDFWESSFQIILNIALIIMRFAPLGVFCLVTPILFRSGWELIRPLFGFVATVITGLVILSTVVFYGVIRYWAGIKPFPHYCAMVPAVLTAFSSASSSATLPVTMDILRNKRHISSETVGFSVPLCTSINLCGTVLYECVAILFIAQIFWVHSGYLITGSKLIYLATLLLLTSLGMAGIPSASLVTMSLILNMLSLPVESLAIIWATDRILDMCRTAVNVFSSSCCALVLENTPKTSKMASDSSENT